MPSNCATASYLDIANLVWNQKPIDLKTGFVNVVWQGYANAVAW